MLLTSAFCETYTTRRSTQKGCRAATQTMVFELFGVCGLLVQTVVLRYMLLWLGETRVLTTGLVAALLEMLLVAFLKVKWQVGL